MENEDAHAIRANTQLSACSQTLQDLSGAVHYMLDDVMVASDCPQKQDVLMAWNNGYDHVMTHRRFVSEMVEETIDFMDDESFWALHGDKKVYYYDTLRVTEKDLERIDKQCDFYFLLSRIEHTEQTIAFFWQNLKWHRDEILYRQINGTLAERGLSIHKKQLLNNRGRLRYEINNVLSLINRIVKSPQFSLLTDLRQGEYKQKYHTFSEQLWDIDVD